jgi:hypothetical protein
VGAADVSNGARSGSQGTVGFPITFVQRHGTFGSLTFRVFGDKLTQVAVSPVLGNAVGSTGGEFMRIIHVCYAALGFAVARWFFKREALAVVDPVARLRSSGLL